jgi:hypothetical protein
MNSLLRKALAGVFAAIALGAAFVSVSALGESHFVELDGARLHYTNYGQGHTALVFIHGWSCDETVWSEQATALGEKISCAPPDRMLDY